MRRGVVVTTLAALLWMSAAPAEAQRRGERRGPPSRVGQSGYFGVSAVAANAVGNLGRFFDQGFGAQFEGAMPIAADGKLRMRMDLGFLTYGLERESYCFSLPIGCRIGLDLTTANNIFFGGVGPEWVLVTGVIEPYLRGTVGFSYFVTTSSLGGQGEYGDSFGNTTHLSDAVLAWKGGGGVRIRLKSGRQPIALDLGVDRHQNGVADFLTKGDIVDHADGSISVFPNRSQANLMTFRMGVSVGIPDKRQRR